MSALLKKIVFVVAIVITLLFLSLLGAVWYLGAFSGVSVAQLQRPTKYFITTSDSGTYQTALNDLDMLQTHISGSGINSGDPAIFLYNDPMFTPLPQVITRAAYVLTDSINVPLPYQLVIIPARSVLTAEIHANPSIAPYKTYPALHEWIQRYYLIPDTTGIIVEYYQQDGTVIVEFPLVSK